MKQIVTPTALLPDELNAVTKEVCGAPAELDYFDTFQALLTILSGAFIDDLLLSLDERLLFYF